MQKVLQNRCYSFQKCTPAGGTNAAFNFTEAGMFRWQLAIKVHHFPSRV
jgi:hypothetical protein